MFYTSVKAKMVAFFMTAMAVSSTVFAQTNCPVNEKAIPQIPQLRSQLLLEYQRFYCVDRRMYFDRVNYQISKYPLNNSALVSEVARFQNNWNLPLYNTERRMGNDNRRIDRFNEEFRTIRRNQEHGSPRVLDDYQVILVGGFGNDMMQDQTFVEMKDVLLNEYQLPPDQLSTVFPDSFASLDEAKGLIERRIEAAKQRHPKKKVILLGFSRGGLATVAALLSRPDLVSSVHAAVTLQSPLKGTPTTGVAGSLLAATDTLVNKVGRLFKCDCANSNLSAGANSMKEKNTYNTMLAFELLNDEQRAAVSKVLFYMTAQSKSQFTKIGTYIMKDENDGTVPYSSQYIRGFGRRLADMKEIGHTDLIMSDMKSGLEKGDRKAFARTLFNSLTREETFSEGILDQ